MPLGYGLGSTQQSVKNEKVEVWNNNFNIEIAVNILAALCTDYLHELPLLQEAVCRERCQKVSVKKS